jgi:hypothetical protein
MVEAKKTASAPHRFIVVIRYHVINSQVTPIEIELEIHRCCIEPIPPDEVPDDYRQPRITEEDNMVVARVYDEKNNMENAQNCCSRALDPKLYHDATLQGRLSESQLERLGEHIRKRDLMIREMNLRDLRREAERLKRREQSPSTERLKRKEQPSGPGEVFVEVVKTILFIPLELIFVGAIIFGGVAVALVAARFLQICFTGR